MLLAATARMNKDIVAELKPHRIRSFKLSNDPQFVEKLTDVVGLYLNPPEHALVFCANEKSQIQALERTQKSLPLYPGRCGTKQDSAGPRHPHDC